MMFSWWCLIRIKKTEFGTEGNGGNEVQKGSSLLSSMSLVKKLNRPQHALHDFALVHLLEGFVPFGDGPDAADDGLHVELSAGEQRDDALPDGPVVAEAAL